MLAPPRRWSVLVGAVLCLTVLPVAVASTPVPVAAQGDAVEVPQPAQWPSTPAASPRVEGFPHAVRFFGADRFQTGLALSLALRGTGNYPFDSPDRSSAGAATLAAASGWWGAGRCPRAVVVVAGDSPADALAASALSDPTGRSTEPFLERTSAADPLFDPVGGFARVDTDSAPVLLTPSARSGATSLSPATRIAAADLRRGGCTTARQAIVVGGPAAVPAGVEQELISIGYDDVFRIAGADRYDTAAQIARSLGTAGVAPGTGCSDAVTSDGTARMGFYANAVVELRASPTSCRLLPRSVVLTDGVTGADALAAGWWTSFWQVPVLLHDGDDTLPLHTAEALQTMDIETLIVLGGRARVSETVATTAAELAGAEVVRIAGDDRYDTSVEMAQQLGGWWPTGRGDEFAGSMVCLTASSGNGSTGQGWADALAAGPWCGALSGAAGTAAAPLRALPPVNGPAASTVGERHRPAHDAVPVLLVPAGSTVLSEPVAQLLQSAFQPGDRWCSGVSAPPGCLPPGFVVAFGGPSVIADEVVQQASALVSGGANAGSPGGVPRLDEAFHTNLDLAPVFDVAGSGPERVCSARGRYRDGRWLAVFDPSATKLLGAADLVIRGRYRSDADGVARSPGVGAPACVAFAPPDSGSVGVRVVGPTGSATQIQSIPIAPSQRLETTAAITDARPDAASGADTAVDPVEGGASTLTFVTLAPATGVSSRGESAAVSSAAITVTIDRGAGAGDEVRPDEFSATWTLTTPRGTVNGTASGEALLLDGTWRLRGRSAISSSSWNVTSGTGGFRADLAAGLAGPSDDSISWRVDASTTR